MTTSIMNTNSAAQNQNKVTNSPRSFTVIPVRNQTDLTATIELFTAYSKSLNIDLSFQDFQTEMSSMPGKYAPLTGGELLLARRVPNDKSVAEIGEAIGCVALRALHADINGPCTNVCEMKRLYVDPSARGLGLGRALAAQIITVAGSLGYEEMRLDTLSEMTAAKAMYVDLGFRDIEPYCVNPHHGVKFLGLQIKVQDESVGG